MRLRVIIAGVCVALGLAACGSTTTVTQTQPAATAASQQPAQTATQVVKTVTQTQSAPTSTPTPAPPQNSSSGGTGGSQTVPGDVVGKKLDDAEDELDGMNIQYSVDSGDHIVILRGDWGVCSTTPAPGQAVSGAIVLHVGHFSCGA